MSRTFFLDNLFMGIFTPLVCFFAFRRFFQKTENWKALVRYMQVAGFFLAATVLFYFLDRQVSLHAIVLYIFCNSMGLVFFRPLTTCTGLFSPIWVCLFYFLVCAVFYFLIYRYSCSRTIKGRIGYVLLYLLVYQSLIAKLLESLGILQDIVLPSCTLSLACL